MNDLSNTSDNLNKHQLQGALNRMNKTLILQKQS